MAEAQTLNNTMLQYYLKSPTSINYFQHKSFKYCWAVNIIMIIAITFVAQHLVRLGECVGEGNIYRGHML